jgi:predicted dehydrogenase
MSDFHHLDSLRTSRRSFVKKTALGAAGLAVSPAIWTRPGFARVNTPSNEVRFGAIGIRGMGFSNINSFLQQDDIRCVAICDVDDEVIVRRSADTAERQGAAPEHYKDYRRLLERDDLDFVIIGSPDHWHCLQAVHAMEAGLDVYLEKPLANSIGECDIILAASQQTGRKVQMGQWQRSGPHWRDAVNFVHSGALGNIRTVKAWAYQGWMKPVPILADEATPAGVDYDMWLGPMALRPFNRNRFHFNFRWFWDYAGGLMTDWGVHIVDYALYGMNAPYPKSVMATGGKMAYPDDASETPDTLQAVFDFGEFTMLWEHATGIDLGPYGRTHGVAFIGNNGTLVVDRGGWEVIPEEEGGEALVQVPAIAEYEGSDVHRPTQNFSNALRNGEALNADVGVGHKAAVVCHMGNVAYKTGRKVNWDQAARSFVDDDEANALKWAQYKNGWDMPGYRL